MRLRAVAEKRPRFGYRRLWWELVQEGWQVNPKRVYRLYWQEGMALRCRRRRKFLRRLSMPAPLPQRRNQRWSMDFVSDSTATGQTVRDWGIFCATIRERAASKKGGAIFSEQVH